MLRVRAGVRRTEQTTPGDSFLGSSPGPGDSPAFEEFWAGVEEKRLIPVMTELVGTGQGSMALAHVHGASEVDRRTGELIPGNPRGAAVRAWSACHTS